MNSLVLGGTAVVVAFSVGFGLWYRAEAHAQQALTRAALTRAAAAEAREAQLETSLAALQGHLTRTEASRDHWATVAKTLQEKEGHDEVLSPYLRALLDSLRGQGGGDRVPSATGP